MPTWLLCCLATVVCFGIWNVIPKALPENMSAFQSQAFSTLGALPIMAVLAISPNRRVGERKLRGSLCALTAGVLVGLGNTAFYQALAAGANASTAASLTSLYPVTTAVLAIVLLGEKPGPWQRVGIAASLAAIYLLNPRPEGGILSGWLGYALAAVVLWGVAGLVMKVSTHDVSAELATFWFLAAFIPLGAVLVAVAEMNWTLPARDWGLLTLLGATYGLGNLSLLAAFRSGGKASVVTPLSGLYPVVTIPLAIVLFHESVGPREWAGIALALAAGVALCIEPKKTPTPDLGGQPPP